MFRMLTLLHNFQSVQECDATGDAIKSNSKVHKKKLTLL